MARMKHSAPTMKVWGATLGSALSVILIWLVEEGLIVVGAPRDIPEGVEVAIATVLTFVAGYFIPPSPHDQVVIDDQPEPVEQETTP